MKRRVQHFPPIRARLDAAKAQARQEERERDEWLCQMAADRDAYHMIDVQF